MTYAAEKWAQDAARALALEMGMVPPPVQMSADGLGAVLVEAFKRRAALDHLIEGARRAHDAMCAAEAAGLQKATTTG